MPNSLLMFAVVKMYWRSSFAQTCWLLAVMGTTRENKIFVLYVVDGMYEVSGRCHIAFKLHQVIFDHWGTETNSQKHSPDWQSDHQVVMARLSANNCLLIPPADRRRHLIGVKRIATWQIKGDSVHLLLRNTIRSSTLFLAANGSMRKVDERLNEELTAAKSSVSCTFTGLELEVLEFNMLMSKETLWAGCNNVNPSLSVIWHNILIHYSLPIRTLK